VVGDVTAAENVPGDLAHFREILMKRRQEILDNQKPLADSMIDTNTRQGDLADQANGNNEVHIHLKLKQTDAKILIAIEEAIQRVEAGTYGLCRDCGDQISKARLEAIPWTRVCISCKEKQKA
jgi:DnaK suppressor protein